MNKGIILASLITLIILVTLLITGCRESLEIQPEPFTTTWSLGEERKMFSISGNSNGHAACKQSEFQFTLNNRFGYDHWKGSYCILLVNHEEIVKEIIHEKIDVPVGQEMRKTLTFAFPVDVVKGSIGLCVVIPQRASIVTTLWIGEKKTSSVEPWPDIKTCPHFLTEVEKHLLK